MWRSIKGDQILACCYMLMCEKSKAEKEVKVVTYKMHGQQVCKIPLVSCHSLIGYKCKNAVFLSPYGKWTFSVLQQICASASSVDYSDPSVTEFS